MEADKELAELTGIIDRLNDKLIASRGTQTKPVDVGGIMTAYKEAETELIAWRNRAVVAELKSLNLYYLQHDGEGEHQLAAQFDKRIATLTKEEGAV